MKKSPYIYLLQTSAGGWPEGCSPAGGWPEGCSPPPPKKKK
uniref:Uncharacterized protein n=1 Tax=Lepeophtheirus salmonis TaxID=72036 RepID=A0A0K2U1J8_LEPSM